MGASTAHLLGKLFRRNEDDCKMLLAAGAGAGLATAFNAPIGGAVFVLEELVRRFDTRITIVTLRRVGWRHRGGACAARRCAGLPCRTTALPRLWHGAYPSCAWACRRVTWGRLQPRTPRYACRGRATSSMAGGTACRARRRGSRDDRMVRPRLGSAAATPSRSARSPAQRPLPYCRLFFCFGSDSGRCRMRRGHRADCSRPSWYWGPRAVFSSAYSATNGSPPSDATSNSTRRCRHGRVFHRGGAGPGHRYHIWSPR